MHIIQRKKCNQSLKKVEVNSRPNQEEVRSFRISKLIFKQTYLLFILLLGFSWEVGKSEVGQVNNYPKGNIVSIVDTLSVYQTNWDRKQIFAYLGEPKPKLVWEELWQSLSEMKFVNPCYGKIWRGFGRGHKGLDIDLQKGDPVVAAFDGKVRYAMYNRGGFGNLVIIRHPNGLETWYAHLSKIEVKPDDVIQAGELIGLGGSTGRSRSPHLHLEFRYKDMAIDPLKLVDLQKQTVLPKDSLTLLPELVIRDSIRTEFGSVTLDDVAEVWHRVSKGDNLSKLAQRYGTTVSNICRLNKLRPGSLLQIGQQIRVG